MRKGSYARWNIGETDQAVRAAGYERAGARAEAEIISLWPKVAEGVYAALETRAADRVESLRKRLADREDADAATITAVLTDLRDTIGAELARITGEEKGQLTFDFNPEERSQFERDAEALQRRLDEIPDEIEREVAAVRARYAAPTPRLFPAAVEFLYPAGGVK